METGNTNKNSMRKAPSPIYTGILAVIVLSTGLVRLLVAGSHYELDFAVGVLLIGVAAFRYMGSRDGKTGQMTEKGKEKESR